MMPQIIEYDELDSTNDEAKRLLRDGAVSFGAVVTAKKQSAGRGRLGKGFVSPGGESVYASFILPPPENPSEQLITALAAVAVCKAVEKTTDLKPGIKWVNDVLVRGKKICGILAEAIPGAVILGIGVNINIEESDFPAELLETAASLKMNAGERELFFATLTEMVFQYTAAEGQEAKDLMDEYRARSVLTGQSIIVFQGEKKHPAFAIGIADDGALIVRYQDGSADELRTGEASVRADASA